MSSADEALKPPDRSRSDVVPEIEPSKSGKAPNEDLTSTGMTPKVVKTVAESASSETDLVANLSPEDLLLANTNRQDYRLDFTEVERVLEAVPEEATATLARTTSTITTSTTVMCSPQVTSSQEPRSQIPLEASSPPLATFHISESNASDIGALSEYSFPANGGETSSRNSYMAGLVKNSQPLSAKQQVALWLTRTSMSDMSSMPSLRSLVFPSSRSNSYNRRQEDHSSSHRKSARSEKNRACRGNGDVHRNFSTKSLINGYGQGQGKDAESLTPIPMRKCETVMAISGGMSTRPSSTSVISQAGTNATEASSRRSSMSLFRKLTGRSRGTKRAPYSMSCQGERAPGQMHPSSSTTGMRTPRGAGFGGQHSFSMASDVFGDSGNPAPFPVSTRGYLLG